jgi:hypothetical protein
MLPLKSGDEVNIPPRRKAKFRRLVAEKRKASRTNLVGKADYGIGSISNVAQIRLIVRNGAKAETWLSATNRRKIGSRTVWLPETPDYLTRKSSERLPAERRKQGAKRSHKYALKKVSRDKRWMLPVGQRAFWSSIQRFIYPSSLNDKHMQRGEQDGAVGKDLPPH